MHEVALRRAGVPTIRKANKALCERRRPKKTHFRLGGSLTIQEAEDLLDQKAVDEQVAQETCQGGSRTMEACTTIRYCGVCGKPGHNARTCQHVIESSDSAASDIIAVDF